MTLDLPLQWLLLLKPGSAGRRRSSRPVQATAFCQLRPSRTTRNGRLSAIQSDHQDRQVGQGHHSAHQGSHFLDFRRNRPLLPLQRVFLAEYAAGTFHQKAQRGRLHRGSHAQATRYPIQGPGSVPLLRVDKLTPTIATAIQTNDIFFYLSEVLPLPVPLAAALATRQKKLKRDEGMPDDDEPEPAAPLPPPPSLPTSTPAPATSTAPQAQSPATPHNPRLVDLMNPAPGSNGTQVAEGDETQMTLDSEA
jgi:hypothetical protein